VICLASIPLGGIIYLAAGRVRAAHEYQRGYRAAMSTVSGAGEVVWSGLGNAAGTEFGALGILAARGMTPSA
jgi:hypothetical protein